MTISRSDPSKNRRVLVVGGRGFVGSNVVRALLAAGIAVDLFGPPMTDDLLADVHGRFREFPGSVEDRSGLHAVMTQCGHDAVITTAAHGAGRQGLMRSGEAEGDRALAVNVGGLRNVFEAARQAGVSRVIWTSSTVVYGPASLYGAARVTENDECRPVTFYGLTKLLGEQVAQFHRDRHGQDIVGLRLPLVLGHGLWYSGAAGAIVEMLRAAHAGNAHSIEFHDEPVDFMHAADVADAVVAVLGAEMKLGAVYNINGFTARISDFIELVAARFPQARIDLRQIAPAHSFPLVDDGSFRQDTGFAPVRGIAEILDDMLSGEEGRCSKIV